MNEFQLDPELHDAVKGIREGVRKLFEQLRLRNEDGDISGKERLERVSALAKRNFRNLSGASAELAIKEAWRLIDFLEGNAEARLSQRAREALRLVELDKQLEAFRASNNWRDTAARLRERLSFPGGGRHLAPLRPSAASIDRRDTGSSGGGGFDPAPQTPGTGLTRLASAWPRRLLFLVPSVMVLIVLGWLVTIWWSATSTNPRYACIALETASERTLKEHQAAEPASRAPRPPYRADALPHALTISDPPNGGPVQSIWTTSQFSYAERTTRPGPGGGRSDFRLRVGGWGDTYLSLLQVPVPTNRLVQKAVIQLTVLEDAIGSRPTSMTLRAIHDSWEVRAGPNNRLWWRDCPQSSVIRNHLPRPGPRDSVYEIEITDLYNLWALGQVAPNGIMLEPEHIGSWDQDRPRYSNFSTFYSTRARDPANRPRLILTY